MSIRVKLTIIFLLLAIVPMFLISYIAVNNYKTSLEKAKLGNLQDIVALKANIIQEYFTGLINDIKMAQGLYSIKVNFRALSENCKKPLEVDYQVAKLSIDEQLKALQSVLHLTGIYLFDNNANIVYSSNSRDFPKKIASAAEGQNLVAFNEGKKKIYSSELFVSKKAKELKEILISAPVHNYKDELMGVIIFEVDLKFAYALVSDITGLGETGEIVLAKKINNAIFLISPQKYIENPVPAKKKDTAVKMEMIARLAISGKSGAGKTFDYRGERVIAAWKKIPLLNWGIAAKMDEYEAVADTRMLQKKIVAIFFIMVVISMTVISFAADAISRPIRKLSESAELIGKGEFDHEIKPGTKDEIGKLSLTFNEMALSLKEYREKLLQSKEELNRAKRLSDIGALAATVAHELRNPLAAISISAFNIKRKTKEPLMEEQFKRINCKIKESNEIINNLLFYSNIKESHHKCVALDKVIIECVEIAQNRFTRKKNPVKLSLINISIDADENQMKSMFNNILNNAYDAISDDGEIEVKAEDLDDIYVKISFKDDGIGIPGEQLNSVFDPFFTTKAKGTGLGLTICKQIVSLHQGRINFDSMPGKGTTVNIMLPKVAAKANS